MSDADPECRWCYYCGVDCDPVLVFPVHREDCPERTGLYPVEAWLTEDGGRCMDCNTYFELGGFYVKVREEQNHTDIVCVGCGALCSCC